MDTYPDIIYSQKLMMFFRNEKNITLDYLKSAVGKPSKPTPPLKPSEPKKPESLSFSVFIAPLIFSAVAYFLSNKKMIYAVLTYFAILGFIFYEMISYKKQYQKDLKKFNEDSKLFPESVKKFEADLNSYEKEIQGYSLKIKEIEHNLLHDDSFKKSVRLKYILDNNLLSSIIPKIKFENINKGVEESNFRKYLDRYFVGEIFTDTVIEIFEYNKNFDEYDFSYLNYESLKSNNAYVPDFLFIHKKSKLVIDIEIDEPYHMSIITHYQSNLHDMRRNTYFSERGLVTIRFSEEQVKNDPAGCCAEIANLISSLTGDFTYLQNLIHEPIYKHRKWTREDALELKKVNFRERKNVRMSEFIKTPSTAH